MFGVWPLIASRIRKSNSQKVTDDLMRHVTVFLLKAESHD